MKKSILTVALLVAGIATAFAAATAQATLSYGASEVSIYEGAAWSDAFDNGYDAKDFNKTGIAVIDAANQRWAEWATNDLSKVEFDFGFSAAPAADVVITISGVKGDVYIAGKKVANGDQITLNPADFDTAGKLTAAGKAKLAVATAAPTVAEFCFRQNLLTVNGHAGESLIIKEGATVIENISSLPAAYSKDLSAKSGRLEVVLNDVSYFIDANPAVTVVP